MNWEKDRINFYNKIYEKPNNHWRRQLFYKFDHYFTELIHGNCQKNYENMLEVGSDGRFFETFTKNNNLDLNISVIDISQTAINMIKKKFPTINSYCEDFFTFAEKKINQNQAYDIIYSNGTFEHFREIEKSLLLSKELVSDSGFFLMAVPNNLGYEINKNDQSEGFKELNGGSRQTEWHLFLGSWIKIIQNVGFKYHFFRGFDERIGFIFFLYK